MVGVFRRSVSFNPSRPLPKPQISHHIRSISLPCRSHPLISQIKNEINDLTKWASNFSTSKSQQFPLTSTNLSHGLTLLKNTHETLQDILQLPQTQESLRCHPLWVENLLEDSLRFVDVYGMFQTSILSLKEEYSSAQIAIRKRDESKLLLYLKAKKKLAKEIEKLVTKIRRVTITQQNQHNILQVPVYSYSTTLLSVTDTAELGSVIEDIMNLTVSVSVTLFNGIAMSFVSRKLTWTQIVKLSRKSGRMNKEHEGIEEIKQKLDSVEGLIGNNMKNKGDEEVRLVLKRMKSLEDCICGIESVSQKIFKTLINSRVLLLNTLTVTQKHF